MNRLHLAVAGGRKTQSIVDACNRSEADRRRLVVTYTQTGQSELEDRLSAQCSAENRPRVMGWYQFLLAHWLRPFLALYFPGRELRGFNYEGEPAYDKFSLKDTRRFFDSDGAVFALHLVRLAMLVSEASEGAVLDRLSRIYDEIYVDEVQDLTGCDLHILESLMHSSIDLTMVGDLRQSIVETNTRDRNLNQYKGLDKVDWYRKQEKAGLLEIVEMNDTYRSTQVIAELSDSVLPAAASFPATFSQVKYDVEHQGVFLVHEEDVAAYVQTFAPLCLRDRVSTFKHLDLPFSNFGQAKGVTADHVLIAPNGTIREHLAKGTPLANRTSCGLYVGITRAKYSVAFVMDEDDVKVVASRWTVASTH